MLVFFSALVAGLAGGWLAGGRLRNLETLRLTQTWLVAFGLLLQVVAFSPIGIALGSTAIVTLHLASYAFLGLFVLRNRRRPEIVVAGVGAGTNLAAIAANGGYMPASPAALEQAGVTYAGDTYNNSGVANGSTHLAFLGDVFATPSWLPAANVFSVGDILIVVGVAALIAFSMRGRRPQEAKAQ